MPSDHQKAILTAMQAPGFYPHWVDAIARLETHISTVFLTGPYVYKVKKPVNLGFLDFTRLDRRTYYCHQEISLNRRLSTGVYLDVLPVTWQKGAPYVLNGGGDTVESVVRMRQLNESDSMLQRLRQSRLTDMQTLNLVSRLVIFYDRAPPPEPKRSGGEAAWFENLELMRPFVGEVIDEVRFSFIASASQAFHLLRKRLFDRRIENGKVVDGHGDLRCEHIYFTADGIQIIDCIEFSDNLRIVDTINDLAFLAMDLEYNGFLHQARLLIREFIRQTDDLDALPLLDFYRCYRAMVRCKVNCFLLEETDLTENVRQSARAAVDAYLTLAHGYAITMDRPMLWVVCGLPASGKSTLAKALGDVYSFNVFRSDEIRKALFAQPGHSSATQAFEKGLYSADTTQATYQRMLDLARKAIETNHGAIIDATFSRDSSRRKVLAMAAECRALPIFVECLAADNLLTERLRKRETEPSLSDARLTHLEHFKKRYEPIADIAPAIHVQIDTQAPVRDCLRQLLLDDRLWNVLMNPPTKGGSYVF